MRHAGSELAKRRKLLLHDDLVLCSLKVRERVLELLVLALELLCQLLDQVKPLDFERVTAKDLQRRGHVRDLASSVDHHFRFDIALGHPAHPIREPPETPHQYAADEQP